MSETAPGICPVCGTEVAKAHRMRGNNLSAYTCKNCGAHLLSNVTMFAKSPVVWTCSVVILAMLIAGEFDLISADMSTYPILAVLVIGLLAHQNYLARTTFYTLRPEPNS